MRWTQDAPTVSGFYEVRMRAKAWPIDPMRSRIIRVEVPCDGFDAEVFGGRWDSGVFEWRGPIEVPECMEDKP